MPTVRFIEPLTASHPSLTLIEYALAQEAPVFILTKDAMQTKELSQALWSTKPQAFLAHILTPHWPEAPNRLTIYHSLVQATSANGLLINFSEETLLSPPTCAAILEIIPIDPKARNAARVRYSHYKGAGFNVSMEQINASGESNG